MRRTTHFPADLAAHVAARLRAELGYSPSERVLVRLLETLYFASLKTDEGRPPLCTINFFDPQAPRRATTTRPAADHWSEVRFDTPLPLDVRSLTKLARATDPAVSSIAVYCDEAGNLAIHGLVDQELRYSDFIALDSAVAPERAGLFQVSITGVGSLSASVNYSLAGSLEQNTLIREYHDVLWAGPVHDALTEHFRSYLAERVAADHTLSYEPLQSGLHVRWINALCRILMNMQQRKHGGGLMLSPTGAFEGLNVKYRIHYDRLPQALIGVDLNEFLRACVVSEIGTTCQDISCDSLSCSLHYQQREFRKRFEEHKSEVLGCAHFIASLSCVDGFVLMDRHLAVHGFGVEVRSGEPVERMVIAGDPLATPKRLRPANLSQFGTRHRAMMRYCHETPGSLGFVVSQDGDIRAMMRVGDRLVLWENIDAQLAFRAENGALIRHENGSPFQQGNQAA